jgi:hypothetical protein
MTAPKMARCECYGYRGSSDGKLEIDSDEARVIRWIFEQYLATALEKSL